jgi:uncharacterized repeat protein (TIGR03803 family)
MWGTTSAGSSPQNAGAVFRIASFNGTYSQASFYESGMSPLAGLVYDGNRYLYGVSRSIRGAVFRSDAAYVYDAIYNNQINFTDYGRSSAPSSGLVSDASGYLWGVTKRGGWGDYGSIYKADPSTGERSVMASFDRSNSGATPLAGLVSDNQGFFWGTASTGGSYDSGVAYKVSDVSGALTAPVVPLNVPMSRLASDGAGFLWGTDREGGANGLGQIFKMNPSSGVFTTMVNFTGNEASNKGSYPEAGLVADGAGFLWGTTAGGGTNGHGTLFKAQISNGQLTTLVHFSDNGAFNKGKQPSAVLVKGENGFFWGTTKTGGANGFGTLFKVDAATGVLTTLVEFTGKTGSNAGSYPSTQLADDGAGSLWGLTQAGGTGPDEGYGTAFKINKSTGILTNLVMFNGNGSSANCGARPQADSLLKHTDGNFYGTTAAGGPKAGGTVFRLRRGPTGLTQAVTNHLGTGVTLNAFVNPNGEGLTTASFQYSLSPTLAGGTTVSAGTVANGTAASPISLAISGLTVGSTYYYRVLTSNAGNEVTQQGNILNFVTADITTATPTMTSPSSNTVTKGPVNVAFNLPEAAASGKLTLRFSGSGTSTLTLASSQETAGAHSFSFDPANPTATAAIASISGGSTVTNGLHTVTLSYQDVLSNPAATAVTSSVRIDTTPPTFNLPANISVNATSAAGAVVTYSASAVDTGGSGISASSFVPASGSTFPIGVTTVNASATDVAGNAASGSFTITVLSNAPTIANVPDTIIGPGEDLVEIPLSVGDVETPASALILTASSSNTSLVPNQSILLSGSGTSRSATITPVPGLKGTTTITLTVNDGGKTTSDTFLLTVVRPGMVLERPVGTVLQDGITTLSFGTVLVPDQSLPQTVTVHNTGNAVLSGLTVIKGGPNSADFIVSPLGITTLDASLTITFTVTFKPTSGGLRSASLHVSSNETGANPFDLLLTGDGLQPPGFSVHPQSTLVRPGTPAAFTATAIGYPAVTYQWKKGTANIAIATADEFTIPVTKAADAAAYSVVADNPIGPPVPSQSAYLGLVTLSQGTQILKKGAALSLKCTVAAPVAPGVSVIYSWRRSGNVLSNGTQANLSVITGADKAALSITKIGTEDAGNYTCLVTLNTPGNDPFTTNGDTVVQVVDAVPVLNPIPLPAVVSVSQPIDELITASNFPTGFSLVGLPAGMTFDTKTGRLKGKPTTPSLKNKTTGLYIPNKLTFKAANPFNAGPALDFYLTIEPLDPTIVGTFNGVVSRESYSNFGMGGYVQVTVASTGVVSGFATLAGQKHSVVGSLDISVGNDPTAELLIKRTPASLGNLELTMNIIRGNDLMQGRITDPEFEIVTGNQDLGGPNIPGFTNGSMGDARFNGPRGIALRPNGDGFLADTGNHVIRLVANDAVTTFAGTANVAGESNGTGTAASFESPEGMALDTLGNLYVADTGNAMIRKITALGVVTTFAGTADQIGNTNATGAAARFNQPSALCFDPAGNLYVVDRGNHTIRKITPAGVVTTLAGKADTAGHKDGGGIAALFNTPRGIVYEPVAKALFVTDSGNNVIRKVTLTGTVTTHAGSPGVEGYADGLLANARFIEPMGIATVGNGILIVGDKVLRQINPNGVVGAVTGYVDLNGLDQPVALAFNEADEVLIAVHETLNGVTIHQPSGTGVEAMFDARRNPWTATSNVAQVGGYTAGIETSAASGDLSLPQGDGYATLAISKTGVATWAGKAADGIGFTFSTIMAGDLSIPLHAIMYKNTGSLQGECFINATTLDLVSDVIPAFDWYKIPQPLVVIDRSYKGGFLVHPLELSGGKYTPNNIYTFLGLTGAPANLTMDFSEAGLTSFTVPFTIATPNTVNVPTNSSTATLKIDPKTGIYTGSFKSGSPTVTSSFTGVIIDYEAGNAKRGYGHFLLPESLSLTSPMTSGRVRLEK